jgi:predicted phosphate transport protein (TIGR00153 family)
LVGSKEKRALKEIVGHMELVSKCVGLLAQAYDCYIRTDEEAFAEKAEEMRGLEKEADSGRRQVEITIYSGAFMPIHREDYLNLAETIDQVADTSVAVVNLLELTGIRIPDEVQGKIAGMISNSIRCTEVLNDCVSVCIKKMGEATKMARNVEKLEELIDEEEFALRSALYRMDIDGYEKILLNQLVEKIGDISDTAEDASDLIVIMLSKRG